MQLPISNTTLIAFLCSVPLLVPGCASTPPINTEAPSQQAPQIAKETPPATSTPTPAITPPQAQTPKGPNPDSARNGDSSSPSFLGCWSGGPPYDGASLVRTTYKFELNNTFSGKTEVRSRYVNEAFTWEGTWRQDGQYILAVSDKDGSKVAFQIRSNYEIQQVGQNFQYARC
jgi:hypothetical protein